MLLDEDRARGDRGAARPGGEPGAVDAHVVVGAGDRDVVVTGATEHDDAQVGDAPARIECGVDEHGHRRRAGALANLQSGRVDLVDERAADDLLDPVQILLTAVAVRAALRVAAAVEHDAHAGDRARRAVGEHLDLARRERGRE